MRDYSEKEKSDVIEAVDAVIKSTARRSKRIFDFKKMKYNLKAEEFHDAVVLEHRIMKTVGEYLEGAGLCKSIAEMNRLLEDAIIANDTEKVRIMASCGLLALNEFIYCSNGRASYPLHIAAEHDRGDMIPIIFEKSPDADIDETSANGTTPLITAAYYNSVNAGRALLALGADINRPDSLLKTPFIHSAGNGHYDFSLMLLQNGADWRIVDLAGCMGDEYAQKNGHLKIVQLIKEWQAPERGMLTL